MINYKIKVIDYNDLLYNKRVLELYNKEFSLNKIKEIFLKNNWDYEDNLWKFLNNDDKVYEFILNESNYLINVYNNKKIVDKYFFPKPKTINEYVLDCNRIGINFYWDYLIVDKYKPEHLLSKDKIEQFYVFNLNNINKNYELL